jgi:hypothetical protein
MTSIRSLPEVLNTFPLSSREISECAGQVRRTVSWLDRTNQSLRYSSLALSGDIGDFIVKLDGDTGRILSVFTPITRTWSDGAVEKWMVPLFRADVSPYSPL